MLLAFSAGVLTSSNSLAAPGDILFSDDFESGFANWTATGIGNASIGTETANSGTSSMRLRWNTVSATSVPINTTVPGIDISIWVRRGDDAFSEDPEAANENLLLEYLDNSNNWITLDNFPEGTPTGEIFTRSYSLNGAALHANFQLRFTLPSGDGGAPANSGIGWDYWHVDDVIIIEEAAAVPLALGACEDFESGLGNWTIDSSGGGSAGTSSATFSSSNTSMFLRWNVVTVTSNSMDTQTAGPLLISAWIRRGDDAFSEDPDNNEDLVIEYFNSSNSWITLETFPGGGTDGEILIRNYSLPTDASHANFQLRFRQTAGSNADWDYWHIDDVCFLNGLSAYYTMDDSSWVSAGDVSDSSGNGNDGNPLGNVSTASSNPAISGNPGTCGYGVFPANNNSSTIDAVNTTITPSAIGSISFWYNANANWNGGGNLMLFDASVNLGNNGADKYFFIQKRNNGRIRFRLEDNNDTDSQAETANQSFLAGEWVHIAVTWDLLNDNLQIYLNGTLSATSNTNLSGTAPNWNTLYIGDNRTTGVSGGGYSGNSANGLIDEVKVYGSVIPVATVNADMASTRACSSTDHFSIGHDGNAVNCQAETITIEAHRADHSIDTSYTGTINLSTSTAHGDWTVITGTNAINNGTADDGVASYLMDPADMGIVVLGYKNTHIETVSLNVSDGSISETSGSALPSEDADLAVAASGFQFLANGIASTIANQIAGKPSNVAPNAQILELQAIRTNDSTGACEAALLGAHDIELAFECRNPSNCSSRQVAINGNNINGNSLASVSNYSSVSLDFGDATDTTATFILNYPDVGNIALHARYDIPLDDGANTPSGNLMSGSSNNFVVRPFGFNISIPANPAANSALGSVFTAAGNNFTVNIEAVLWQAADDSSDSNGIPDGHDSANTNPADNANLSDNLVALNYGQESSVESIALSALLNLPAAGNDPGLAGGTLISSFVSGLGISNSVRYHEVGIIEIAANINDADYLGAGAVISKSGYVGRFIPNHFAISGGSINNRVDAACLPAASFTYMAEPLRLDFTLTAQDTGNTTLQNYTASFAKLDPNVIGNFNFGAIDSAAPTPLTTRISTDSSSGGWVNGIANVFARLSLDRAAAVDGPYQDVRWGTAPVDSDGVALASFNLDVDNNTVNDHGLIASSELRFGRATVESVSGSELLALRLPLQNEYFNGIQFVRNTDDNCSSYNASDISFSNRQGLAADPLATGSGELVAGSDNTASPIRLDSGNDAGNVDVTLDVPAYLHFDWDDDGNFDNDPSGHITFGIFNGGQRQIYIREVF